MIRKNVLLAKKNPRHKHNKMKLELEENEFFFGKYTLRNLHLVNGNIYGDVEGPRKAVVEVQAFCNFREGTVDSFSIYEENITNDSMDYYFSKCRVDLGNERMEI